MPLQNPKLYEINTRVWINKFSKEAKKANFEDIPDNVWDELSGKGIDIVWLMGIWKTSPEIIKKYCFQDYLVRSYEKALKDFKENDVIGSPFAIDEYVVNPDLGDFENLTKLRKNLNKRGMKLLLDFVPNHFSVGSKLVKTNPSIFLSANEELHARDPHTYFKCNGSDKIFCHGRDPFFPAWEDTIQVNYFCPDALEFMINTLLGLAEYCDGVRCDMAILALDNVFGNTWSRVLQKNGFQKPENKFWETAIKRVKEKYPDFIFIAEAYWDLEWELQQLGFDYTYDKKLTDRLIHGNVRDINLHLKAEPEYQNKSVRFIENHDEDRAANILGKQKSMAAAVIISTIPGMRFYYDGQFEGKRIKLPVQLGRDFEEPVRSCFPEFYNKLLNITKSEIFRLGEWKLLRTLPSWETNNTYQNLLAWQWKYKNECRLIVVNYSDVNSQCRIKLDVSGYHDHFLLVDLLHDNEYLRSSEEVYHSGLYIDLKGWQSHIFAY